MTEKIEAAAIRHRGVTYIVPRPGRHHDITTHSPQASGGEEGFITSSRRFVNRQQGRKIAEKAGQIIPSERGSDGCLYPRLDTRLFSEDVW